MVSDAVAAPPNMQLSSFVGDEVKQFILAHNLDDSATAKLEALTMEQQLDVISQDSANARNMNAVVISRANKSQREGPQFTGAGSQEYVAGIVTKYIEALGLDEKSAEGLRALPPKDQVAVMARDMEGVTNPSGVVDSRVRKLMRGSSAAMAGTIRVAGTTGLAGAVAVGPAARLVSLPAAFDAAQCLEQAYRAFVVQYNIDQRAQEVVAQLSPLEKLEVISQGMENVYNPSGAISSRCAKVKERQVVLGPRAAHWVSEVALLFCQTYGIDRSSDAFQLLQQLPADKQFEVCSKSLEGARNPGSVIYCRIQKLNLQPVDKNGNDVAEAIAGQRAYADLAPSSVPNGSDAPLDVEQFVARYNLDDRAADVLRELAEKDPAAAEEVMLHPIGPEVRNPSGVIHARVTSRTGASRKAVSGAHRATPY
eukprot:CAMPEP_0179115640 /NCGR_PEP_ID=MMETSP0796-20121207/54203_1 /TAXON_ID=73915 /ORGANISM="Pyrodinium bahamense, Strain pbaha01" /LENGTH=423 /DNA_ID=CAMNT_0020813895 /DNA_START=17 /DNA_END=1288 /DNA_ORIENTATION=-